MMNVPNVGVGDSVSINSSVQYAIGVDGINTKVLPNGSTPQVIYRIGDGTVHPEGWDNIDGNKYLDFYVSTGATGATGDKGDTGASAFTQAVENGYTGTEQEFYDLLTNVSNNAILAGEYRDEALLYSNNSANSATLSANSASASASSAIASEGFKDTAVTAMDNAQIAETNASNSASASATSASQASTSATSAEGQAVIATTQSGIATTKASEANDSAISASTSASNASDSAIEAQGYADSIVPSTLITKAEGDSGYLDTRYYTETEIDALPKTVSKVASSVLLNKDSLALDNSVITKSNANVTYTGNGTTQDIVTGISSVDFTVASNGSGYYHDRAAGDCIVKNDAGTVIESGSCVVNTSKVHIKNRVAPVNNYVADGIRGSLNIIKTNTTNSEVYNNTINGNISGFTPTGFSVFAGSDPTYDSTNKNTQTYISHQTLYTHIKWGLTSQGKRYITAYNPVTREVMTMYQGSGVAGHQIPNPLGIKLDYIDAKSLDSVSNWTSTNATNGRMFLNDTSALNTVSIPITKFDSDYTELGNNSGEINSVISTYISYGFANSETKIITQYQGSGASGNFIETKDVNGVAKKPRRVIVKITSGATGDWYFVDSERVDDNYLSLNSSNAETSDSSLISIGLTGFTLNNVYTTVNASGGQYIAIVEFDTTSSNDDTYFDLPTDDTNLTLVNGKLVFTDGRASNGGFNVSTQDFTGSIDFTGISDGIKYVGLDEVGNVVAYDGIPLFNSETGIMYANDEVTPLTSPICFIDDKPYQITSETPMDRLVDYPSIPKNIMETLDVEFIKSRGNRKIIELGTIFNNTRYVIPWNEVDLPVDETNYVDCDVKLYVFMNNIWSELNWFDDASVAYAGADVFSNLEGVVVQTAASSLHRYTSSVQGDGFGFTTDTILYSAPARVIVTYQGETK